MKRRDVLKFVMAGAAGGLAASAVVSSGAQEGDVSSPVKPSERAPVLFVSHGSPMVAVQQGPYQVDLGSAGSRFPRPAGIIVVSAHWQRGGPVRIGRQARSSLIYDFGGFPDALYTLTYDPPSNVAVSERVQQVLQSGGLSSTFEERGLDHGAWIPLRLLWPDASVPVVQVSLPASTGPQTLVDLGRALRPLRDEGYWILGSGGVTHNLRRLRFDDRHAPVEPWAQRFDAWVAQGVARRDLAALADYARLAPDAAWAVPTSEHFDPLFVALGAAHEAEVAQTIHEGFEHATLSMRTFAFAG